MSAGTSPTSPGSGQGKPHAGVKLDVGAIENAHVHDHAHEGVEPIPWKTGDVGVVKAIDRVTPFTSPSASPSPSPTKAPPVPKDAAKMAAAEKASMAAIEGALG